MPVKKIYITIEVEQVGEEWKATHYSRDELGKILGQDTSYSTNWRDVYHKIANNIGATLSQKGQPERNT